MPAAAKAKEKGKGKKGGGGPKKNKGGDDDSDSVTSLGSLHSADSETSLASWNEVDQDGAFANVAHIDAVEASQDDTGEKVYSVEGILRWRRHPRRGFTQYRTMWEGYPICEYWYSTPRRRSSHQSLPPHPLTDSTTWEPEAVFNERSTLQDFWAERGGRPADVPPVESDRSSEQHSSDTERQNLLRGSVGKQARRKTRREFRRDKKQQRAYWKSKAASGKRQSEQGIVGQDVDTSQQSPSKRPRQSSSSSSGSSELTSFDEDDEIVRPPAQKASKPSTSTAPALSNGNSSSHKPPPKARPEGRRAPMSKASLRAIASDGHKKKTEMASTQSSKPTAPGSRLSAENDQGRAPAGPSKPVAGPSRPAGTQTALPKPTASTAPARSPPSTAAGSKAPPPPPLQRPIPPIKKAPSMLDAFMQVGSSSSAAAGPSNPAPGSFIKAHKDRPSRIQILDVAPQTKNQSAATNGPSLPSSIRGPPSGSSPLKSDSMPRKASLQNPLPSVPRKPLDPEKETSAEPLNSSPIQRRSVPALPSFARRLTDDGPRSAEAIGPSASEASPSLRTLSPPRRQLYASPDPVASSLRTQRLEEASHAETAPIFAAASASSSRTSTRGGASLAEAPWMKLKQKQPSSAVPAWLSAAPQGQSPVPQDRNGHISGSASPDIIQPTSSPVKQEPAAAPLASSSS